MPPFSSEHTVFADDEHADVFVAANDPINGDEPSERDLGLLNEKELSSMRKAHAWVRENGSKDAKPIAAQKVAEIDIRLKKLAETRSKVEEIYQ